MKTIKFRDRDELVITEEQADKIEALLLEGKADYFRIDGNMYSRTSVDKIINGGVKPTQEKFIDPWADESRMIGGKKCTSSKSIQSEINKLAQEHHRKQSELNPEAEAWTTLIRDEDWREMMRQTLRSESEEWCDFKAGVCVC